MRTLLDTNVLARLANVKDLQFPDASRAVSELHRRGESLFVTPQVLTEFRSVAARVSSQNGLGLTTAEAENHSAIFESRFPLLEETPAIFPAWKALVTALGVIGKQVHDARLVAVCHVHGVAQLLTFNTGHFTRLAAFGPGIAVLNPSAV